MEKREVVVQEIEITPEMIEAGCGEGAGFNPDYDDMSELVVDVYKAMRLAYL